MAYTYTDQHTYAILEMDHHHSYTPRTRPRNIADAVLPPDSFDRLPPPVPPKDDDLEYLDWPLMAESLTRVTPWLLRPVKTPVSSAPRMARSVSADGPPEPPSYWAAQESYPRVERSPRVLESGNVANSSRGVSSIVHTSRHTPTKPARHDKRDTDAEAQRSVISCPSQWSLRSAPRERSRPRTPTHRIATSESGQPQNRHRPVPFPSPPPYHVSKGCSVPSSQSRSPHRKKSSTSVKEVELPCHPPLPTSAVSRIRAAYKISKEFGDAVMRQEMRVAIPINNAEEEPLLTPRGTRRFVSVTEAEGLRKMDGGSREHEARQRALSKPSNYLGHGYGYDESRQRTVSGVKSNRDLRSRNTSTQRR
ncbi:hypothetical protein BGW80DRAFT_1455557 [Lactifluus volemus]|nr:hypothetical protein BGW80DRAFT_1455557 [Lactifluus volemus]